MIVTARYIDTVAADFIGSGLQDYSL